MRRYSAKDLQIVAAFIQDIIDATVTTRSRLAETARLRRPAPDRRPTTA